MQNKYTSLKLSKFLRNKGFKKGSDWWWSHKWEGSSDKDAGQDILTWGTDEYNTLPLCPAYDILNDLCVKYSDEIFGKKSYKTKKVLELVQQGKKEEAEQYIIDNIYERNTKKIILQASI
jgi:hypothetical protein